MKTLILTVVLLASSVVYAGGNLQTIVTDQGITNMYCITDDDGNTILCNQL